MNSQHSSPVRRPRVLCVSHDRSTRARLTLSLTDDPVEIVIAKQATEAVDCLERTSIDAVVIDGHTVADVPSLVDAVVSEAPETPALVSWGGDDRRVLSEVVSRTNEADHESQLADALADRLNGATDVTFPEPDPPSGKTIAPDLEHIRQTLPAALADIVCSVRCQLVDATSPLTVERTIREELTTHDRFTSAWIGEYDRGERTVVPWLSDCESKAWSLDRSFSVGGGEFPLLERAMCTRSIQTRQYDETSCDEVPFGTRALEHGSRSVAVAPLATRDELYGVIAVYGTAALSESERDAIRAIAATASHVLETIAVRGRLEQRERVLDRYERLVETAGDGMYVLDETGHFMTVNDALVEMSGYSREGLLGEHASFLFDSADIDAARSVIRSLRTADASTDTIDVTLETKAGASIPCEAQIAVLVSDEQFRGTVGVLRNVTARYRREQKLRDHTERLDAFTRIVSHDLTNPLNVAQESLDLLTDTGNLAYADRTREGLDRMEAVIEDVLAIARDGEWVTDIAPVDLEAAAHEAWNHVSTGETTLSISETTTIEADRSWLLRLFEHCFRTSIEHGSTVETVRIGPLEPSERGFFVAANGVGLPEDCRFDPADSSVSSAMDGLGVGFRIVKEVATGHGWAVTATESEGGGVRFEFETDGYLSDCRS